MMHPRGFTLIELLIVVAIIGILATIAVPNFLLAQTKAKVARVQSDFKALATALAAYRLDNNDYPNSSTGKMLQSHTLMEELVKPVPYISSIPIDPFNQRGVPGHLSAKEYIYHNDTASEAFPLLNFLALRERHFGPDREQPDWIIISKGPDENTQDYDIGGSIPWGAVAYDASNGVVSRGDIFRFSD